VDGLAFSPDGTKMVSGSNDLTIRIRDVASEAIHKIDVGTRVRSVAFSPDGRRIVFGCREFPFVRIWDVQAELIVSDMFHDITSSVNWVVFSPDGQQIVSGSSNNSVRIWDAQNGKQPVYTDGHVDAVTSVAISRDGKRIASGSLDNTVRIWDMKTGKIIAKPLQHPEGVYCVSFSSTGRWVLSGSMDGNIRIWDTEVAQNAEVVLSRCFMGNTSIVPSLVVSNDGQWFISAADATVRVWSFATGRMVATLRYPPLKERDFNIGDYVMSLALSPEEGCIVAGTGNGAIHTWDRE
jgi:WD40 repeat protein